MRKANVEAPKMHRALERNKKRKEQLTSGPTGGNHLNILAISMKRVAIVPVLVLGVVHGVCWMGMDRDAGV